MNLPYNKCNRQLTIFSIQIIEMRNHEILQTSFKLPCGVEIPNRLAKSALSETMAGKGVKPAAELIHLYETWGKGSLGLIISGNVMIDSNALGEKKNVVVENAEYLPQLQEWARKCQKYGAHLWMQINHPGRQAPKFNQEVVGPSNIRIKGTLQP